MGGEKRVLILGGGWEDLPQYNHNHLIRMLHLFIWEICICILFIFKQNSELFTTQVKTPQINSDYTKYENFYII